MKIIAVSGFLWGLAVSNVASAYACVTTSIGYFVCRSENNVPTWMHVDRVFQHANYGTHGNPDLSYRAVATSDQCGGDSTNSKYIDSYGDSKKLSAGWSGYAPVFYTACNDSSAGGGEASNLEEMVYEGYGPAGVAVLVETLSDNKNRTVAEVRHAFSKCGGNLGTSGSVAYLFNKTGLITFAPGADEEKIMEAAIEAGANDVQTEDDGSVIVYTSAEDMIQIREALATAGLEATSSEITMLASTEADLDFDNAEKLLRLIDMLEDCDDVQEVYHNANISDEIAAKL